MVINTISLRNLNSIIKKSLFYKLLKKINTLRKFRLLMGRLYGDYLLYKFRLHGDNIHLKALKKIINNYKITSIVETGTYLGYTTMLLAETFPNLQIYTCEINENFYLRAKKNLKKYKNIHIFNGTSPEFIENLINNKLIGERPFFYLDAHWLDDWPLEKELKIITTKIKSSFISIDDFKVENDSRYIYDRYADKECSIDLVKPNLKKGNNYNLLFPNYDKSKIFNNLICHPDLIGYALLFHNMENDFISIKNNNFISRYFKDKSFLINN